MLLVFLLKENDSVLVWNHGLHDVHQTGVGEMFLFTDRDSQDDFGARDPEGVYRELIWVLVVRI